MHYRIGQLALLLVLLALGATARADITLEVGAEANGTASSASDTWGAGVTRVHGEASSSTAHVDTGGYPCLPASLCGFASVPGAVARSDFDADGMHWRVGTRANGTQSNASAGLLVTDTLQLTNWSAPGALMLTFRIRIELDEMSAGRGNADAAGAEYAFQVLQGGGEGNTGTSLFSLIATVDDIIDIGTARSFSVDAFGADPLFSDSIPAVFETAFQVPVIVGPGAPGFELMLATSAGSFSDNGFASVLSLNSAYLGMSVEGATLVSANGYTYTGYVPAADPPNGVPEPSSALLLLAGTCAWMLRRRHSDRLAR